jgi:hypothetical protein
MPGLMYLILFCHWIFTVADGQKAFRAGNRD